MLSEKSFTKEELIRLLTELGKEFRKRNGTKMKAEIIIAGGASVVLNYGFREMTMDIDAVIQASSAMKEAILAVADKNGIPAGWLNSDFIKTASYSDKLVLHSRYYRTFSNVLIVRTVQSEYLVAMKLNSGRRYKRDLSDIVGIVAAEQEAGNRLTWEKIDRAMQELYGGWEQVDRHTQNLLEKILDSGNLNELYREQIFQENEDRAIVRRIMENDSEKLNGKSLSEVIEIARRKRNK